MADIPRYGPTDYDDNACLSVPWMTWLTIAFLLRPAVVFIASVVKRGDRFALMNLFYDHPGQVLWTLAAGLPALLVLIAWWRRRPDAGPTIRQLWRQGRILLIVSLLGNFVMLLWPVVVLHYRLDIQTSGQLILCGILLYYQLRSRRNADAFKDFPAIELHPQPQQENPKI